MTTAPQKPSPPAARRPLLRRLMRDAALILLITSTILTVVILRHPSHAHLLYYQYRISRLQLPADQVLYRFSPMAAIALAPLPFFPASTGAPTPDFKPEYASTEGDDDNCDILPPHVIPLGAAGDPPAVDMFNRYMKYILTDGMQVLYTHTETINGQSRLVIVQFGNDTRQLVQRGMLEVIVLQPGTLSALPRQLTRQRVSTAALKVPYAVTTFFP